MAGGHQPVCHRSPNHATARPTVCQHNRGPSTDADDGGGQLGTIIGAHYRLGTAWHDQCARAQGVQRQPPAALEGATPEARQTGSAETGKQPSGPALAPLGWLCCSRNHVIHIDSDTWRGGVPTEIRRPMRTRSVGAAT